MCYTTPLGLAFVQPDGRAFLPGTGFKTVHETTGAIHLVAFGWGWLQPHKRTVYIPGVGEVADPNAPPLPPRPARLHHGSIMAQGQGSQIHHGRHCRGQIIESGRQKAHFKGKNKK